MKNRTRVAWLGCAAVIALVGVTGCATNIGSKPIAEDHPANPEGMTGTALPKMAPDLGALNSWQSGVGI